MGLNQVPHPSRPILSLWEENGGVPGSVKSISCHVALDLRRRRRYWCLGGGYGGPAIRCRGFGVGWSGLRQVLRQVVYDLPQCNRLILQV